MGGGGSTSGAVEFPDYVMDTHGQIMAGSGINSSGEYSGTPSYPTFTLTDILDEAYGVNPYESVNVSQPTTVLGPMDTQFDAFYDFATGVSTTSIDDLVSSALETVNVGAWTSDLEDINLISALPTASQTSLSFDTAALDTSLSVVTSAHDEITSLVVDGSTPSWETNIQTVADKLRECGITEEAEIKAVISEAATQSQYLLEDAIGVAEQIASRQEITDLVDQYATRRENAHQRHVAQFNAQMADGNAVNSSGYMLGLALLKSQQQRKEAQFDKEITFETFTGAIDSYVQTYAQNLQASTNMEVVNAQQFNQLLSNSVQAILEIKLREWNKDGQVDEDELFQLFTNIFNAQLNASLSTGELALGRERLNSEVERFNSLVKAREEEINTEINRFNKQSREQRFVRGLQATLNLLSNRVEYEKAAADLKTEQKRIELVGRQETEGFETDLEAKQRTWRLQIAESGMNILAAPSGMARRMPEEKSKVSSAIGGALKGAGTGAAIGSVVPGIGTGIGAGIGGILGGVGGAFG